MVPTHPADPPQVFSWTVIDRSGDLPHLGALGVCGDRQRAVSRLTEALREAPPGAHGVVHTVSVSLVEVGYFYGDPIVKAEVDQTTGDVVVDEFAQRGGWGHLDALLRSLHVPVTAGR